jgi:stress response protein SCP2
VFVDRHGVLCSNSQVLDKTNRVQESIFYSHGRPGEPALTWSSDNLPTANEGTQKVKIRTSFVPEKSTTAFLDVGLYGRQGMSDSFRI